MAGNLTALNAYLKTQTLTPAVRVLVELARTLARDLDDTEWSAPVAGEYRRTLDTIAAVLGEEQDEHSDVLRLLSEVGNQTG